MAEWFKRGTVNTFYRGSNPLKTYNSFILFREYLVSYINNLYFLFYPFCTNYFFRRGYKGT